VVVKEVKRNQKESYTFPQHLLRRRKRYLGLFNKE
jgi:hypothetical protein